MEEKLDCILNPNIQDVFMREKSAQIKKWLPNLHEFHDKNTTINPAIQKIYVGSHT
jgi:hypothetical protein